ncbi:glycosyltransferase, partial [Candidatus Sumerlaeota bacterium]|nr:glycosyltransferase [Candidatus Sumerlaeota bacterium]
RLDHEIIVVDDASSDDSAAVARALGARVLIQEKNQGPAAARNRGAQAASGDILWFLDADTEAHPGAVNLIIEFFVQNSGIAAAIGSYDDTPSDPHLVSQFKNLFHHYVHQSGAGAVSSFWSGCGVIRKADFEAAGGFDERYWKRPMIEDIHLGYKLGQLGREIRILPELQVTHHKRWTLRSLIQTDIWSRAVPWTLLLLGRRWQGGGELNLKGHYKLSVTIVWMALLFVLLSPAIPALLVGAAILGLAIIPLNLDLVRFFWGKRGVAFAIGTIPLLWLYFFYCGLGLLIGVGVFATKRLRGLDPLE